MREGSEEEAGERKESRRLRGSGGAVVPKYAVLTVFSVIAGKNHGNQETQIPHVLSQNLPALGALPGQR